MNPGTGSVTLVTTPADQIPMSGYIGIRKGDLSITASLDHAALVELMDALTSYFAAWRIEWHVPVVERAEDV